MSFSVDWCHWNLKESLFWLFGELKFWVVSGRFLQVRLQTSWVVMKRAPEWLWEYIFFQIGKHSGNLFYLIVDYLCNIGPTQWSLDVGYGCSKGLGIWLQHPFYLIGMQYTCFWSVVTVSKPFAMDGVKKGVSPFPSFSLYAHCLSAWTLLD